MGGGGVGGARVFGACRNFSNRSLTFSCPSRSPRSSSIILWYNRAENCIYTRLIESLSHYSFAAIIPWKSRKEGGWVGWWWWGRRGKGFVSGKKFEEGICLM